MKEKELYHTAVYLRLSRDDADDGNGRAESSSISSQRDMILSFIRKQHNMEIYDIYADDGWSGTNFDRPEFKRMMKDIEAGHVDCVIVKDLSRLGRDYIEAGRLIQRTFPAFSVRFIALTDRFDSLTADDNEKALVIPVKNFVNDFYARDISCKVRSHQRIKRERGDFVGAFAVYGYKKSAENRNRLVPDEYAADIVRKVFAWKIEGYSNLAIAGKLDEMGILSPMEYKKMQGVNLQTGFVTGIQSGWSAVAVKRILTNENYTGTLVQGKEEKINYKIKKSVIKPKEEWVRAENAHEAVVSKEDFEIVQELLQTDIRAAKCGEKSHIYAGILFCGDCMEPMIRRVSRYKEKETVSFICATKNKGGACTRHAIREEDLKELVLTGLRQQIALFMDRAWVLSRLEQMEIDFGEAACFEKEIQRMYQEQEKYFTLRTGLYEDFKSHLITEEEFKGFGEIYEKRYLALQQSISNQEKTVEKLLCAEASAAVCPEQMKRVMQITDLDRMTLITFIKRILVYEDKRVSVEWRHRNLFFEEGKMLPAMI